MTMFSGTRLFVAGLLMTVMVASSGLAELLKPTHSLVEDLQKGRLESAIPKSFGDWRIDTSIQPVQVSPDVQASLDRIYSDVLSRTYVDSNGRRVMLSLAYGGEQSRALQVHRPEVCYTAQGFSVTYSNASTVLLGATSVPVKRLVAVLGRRTEPITYWIRVGDQVALSRIDQAIARLRYGLTGTIPDGMLVRASSIGGDRDNQYEVQDKFLKDLAEALSERNNVDVILGRRSL